MIDKVYGGENFVRYFLTLHSGTITFHYLFLRDLFLITNNANIASNADTNTHYGLLI